MSKFLFEADAVWELLNHAKAAPQTVSPYGLTPNPGPGLMLIKDDGVYLMSNGEPPLPGTDTVNKVVYARGYEALPLTVSIGERMERYDKIRDAAGGDDFAELLPATSFTGLASGGLVEIGLTAARMTIRILPPKAAASSTHASKSSA